MSSFYFILAGSYFNSYLSQGKVESNHSSARTLGKGAFFRTPEPSLIPSEYEKSFLPWRYYGTRVSKKRVSVTVTVVVVHC